MKPLIVYHIDGKWYGEVVEYQRSGSGTYRSISRIEVPQSRDAIIKYAAENRYAIEWQGAIPEDRQSA
jgi:hypothetical protein